MPVRSSLDCHGGSRRKAEARASLRQALKHIRERAGEVILASRERIELARPIECDVVRFRLAVHTDPRRAAAYEVTSVSRRVLRPARAAIRRVARRHPAGARPRI